MSKYAWELLRFSDGRIIDSGEVCSASLVEAQHLANKESEAIYWKTPDKWVTEVPEVAKVKDSDNSGVWMHVRYNCEKDQTYSLTPFNTLYIEEKNLSFRPSFAVILIDLDRFEQIPNSSDSSVCKWRKKRETGHRKLLKDA